MNIYPPNPSGGTISQPTPILTDSSGYAWAGGYNENTQYGINIIAASQHEQYSHRTLISPTSLNVTLGRDFITMCGSPLAVGYKAPYISLDQNYGWRYGVGNALEFHRGIDITTASDGSSLAGADVLSSFYGRIIAKKYHQDRGNYVHIQKNDSTLWQVSQHLSGFSSAIQNSDVPISVSMGDVVGYVGNTGAGVGIHLHTEILNTSALNTHLNTVDPFKYYDRTKTCQ